MLRGPVLRQGGMAIVLMALAIGIAYVAAETVRRAAGFSAWPMYLLYIVMLPMIGAVMCGLPLLVSNFRLQRERDQLNQLLCTDPITGVANRRTFFAAAPGMIDRAQAASLPVGMMFVHVDSFSSVRKEHGAAASDQLLRFIAEHLGHVAAESRLPDVLTTRLGRDAFVTLLIGADPSAASQAAERLCELVRASSTEFADIELGTTVSVGVTVRGAQESVDKLVSASDAAARKAMERGGDAWVFAGASAAAQSSNLNIARVA